MKTFVFSALSIIAVAHLSACNRTEDSVRAIDLETGETVTVVKDTSTGKFINAKTGEPVNLFVNTKTKDTIYGPTGDVANNQVRKTEEGKYVYYGKIKDGEFKMERERDGDYKVKYGDDYKEKYNDGEYKVKQGDYKKEIEPDGDVTIKKGDKKVKIDGETGEVKVKN